VTFFGNYFVINGSQKPNNVLEIIISTCCVLWVHLIMLHKCRFVKVVDLKIILNFYFNHWSGWKKTLWITCFSFVCFFSHDGVLDHVFTLWKSNLWWTSLHHVVFSLPHYYHMYYNDGCQYMSKV